MPKKNAQRDWLEPAAYEELDEFWQERLVNILEDLADLPHLRYAYAVGREGVRLSKNIGPGRRIVKGDNADPAKFFHLARITEDYLKRIDQEAPAHVTVELAEEMLFVGSTGALILVASFEGNAARGYVGMKLAKRISHLRNIFRAAQIRRKPPQ